MPKIYGQYKAVGFSRCKDIIESENELVKNTFKKMIQTVMLTWSYRTVSGVRKFFFIINSCTHTLILHNYCYDFKFLEQIVIQAFATSTSL
jgi:hypothetical protein